MRLEDMQPAARAALCCPALPLAAGRPGNSLRCSPPPLPWAALGVRPDQTREARRGAARRPEAVLHFCRLQLNNDGRRCWLLVSRLAAVAFHTRYPLCWGTDCPCRVSCCGKSNNNINNNNIKQLIVMLTYALQKFTLRYHHAARPCFPRPNRLLRVAAVKMCSRCGRGGRGGGERGSSNANKLCGNVVVVAIYDRKSLCQLRGIAIQPCN